jgi:hypothetical protein
MKKNRFRAIVLLACAAAIAPAHAQNVTASLGKQLAAGSKLEWEVREAGHPILGNIQFAFLKTPVETAVGNAKVFSRAYLSCQRANKKLAIELTNSVAPDDPKGLKPGTEPRLFCNRPIQPWDEKLVQERLFANWDVNELGDAMTKGFRAFPLRECVSIRVQQEVILPAGWAQKTAKIEFELSPYGRELDAVFVTCGENSAYAAPAPSVPVVTATAPAAPPKSAAPPPAPAKPAPVAAVPTPPAPPAWRPAQVAAGSKTNVRAGPRLQSPVVTELAGGTAVLVQKTDSEWWRARPPTGAAFDGYIRQDRLVFK